MKPTNILLNRDCELALADLGLARYIGAAAACGAAPPSRRSSDGSMQPPPGGTGAGLGSLTKYVVTRWYRAPELLVQNQRYDAAVDMWSLLL